MSFKCSNCLATGHKKNSPSCPLFNMQRDNDSDINSNRWTNDKESRLIQFVNSSGFEPNWEIIASELNKTEDACKKRYRDIVNPEAEMLSKINRISFDDISIIVQNQKNICSDCNDVFFCSPREWKRHLKCEKCYLKHKSEIDELWNQINDFLIESSNDSCLFCLKKRENGITFHFDHIDMFDKNDSVCSMVRRGESIESIKTEILKCQLLCESCHSIVTHIENTYGFTRIKQNLTKEFNKSLISEDEFNMKKKEFSEKYRTHFTKVYDMIKKIVTN